MEEETTSKLNYLIKETIILEQKIIVLFEKIKEIEDKIEQLSKHKFFSGLLYSPRFWIMMFTILSVSLSLMYEIKIKI